MLTGMVASVGTPHLITGSTEVVWNELSSDVNFRVESDGNANMLFVDAGNDRVGIGTGSPVKDLHLWRDSGATTLRLSSGGTYHSDIYQSATNLFIQNTSVAGNIIFYDDAAERMRIDSDGEVGIGVAAPAYKLDVGGTIRASTGIQHLAVARTATAAGDGTGLIADGTSFVTVTTANAAHIITLPTPVPGTIVWLGTQAESQAFEVRTDTPASVKINGGSASNGESAIAAAAIAVRFVCINATNWLGTYWDADGDEAKVEAAA